MRLGDRASEHPAQEDTPRKDQQSSGLWGSDLLVDLLADLGVEHVAINPGASLRGLHDSLVNHVSRGPRMLLCLHEDAAVSIAHGYAKVTERPMAVFLHANVGVLHGAMGIFNAFCDRVPMLVVGGNGPLDVGLRRPWIDWIHTSNDLGSVLRGFVKWDSAPGSLPAALDALVSAVEETRRAPRAPVFVTVDRALQEEPAPVGLGWPEFERDAAAADLEPDGEAVAAALGVLGRSERPALMVGRVGRGQEEWERRIRLAESLGAPVITDFKTAVGFPTDHPLRVGTVAGLHLAPEGAAVLREADAVIALDWIDLGSTLRQVVGSKGDAPRVIVAGMELALPDRWADDSGATPPADVTLSCDPDAAVAAVLAGIGFESRAPWHRAGAASAEPFPPAGEDELRLLDVITATRNALGDSPATLVRAPHRGWVHRAWEWTDPLDYLGYDGGAGLGSGPGMVVGAALALQDTGRIAVGIIGDGDYLQGCTALWTAAHERIPLLLVVANNGTYQTDEAHQELVARQRGRDVSRRWVGQRMSDPRIDLAALARAQGALTFGPVVARGQLIDALDRAVAAVRAGVPVVVDAHVGEY